MRYTELEDWADRVSEEIYEKNKDLVVPLLEEYKKLIISDDSLREAGVDGLATRIGVHLSYNLSLLWCYGIRDCDTLEPKKIQEE